MSPHTLAVIAFILLLTLFGGLTQYPNIAQNLTPLARNADNSLPTSVSPEKSNSTEIPKPNGEVGLNATMSSEDAMQSPPIAVNISVRGERIDEQTPSPNVTAQPVQPVLMPPKGVDLMKDVPTGSAIYRQIHGKLASTAKFITHLDRPPQFPADTSTHYYMSTDMSPNATDVMMYTWVTHVEVTYHFTFVVDRHALRDALVPVTLRDASRLAIVTFANLRYADVFMNWLVALNRLGIQNYCIFAIDHDTKAWLLERKIPTFGVYMKQFAALWYSRLIVLRNLAEMGVAFIHSDTDAIWVRNPLPQFFTNASAHMKFSQGTVAPPHLQSRWGFVTCGGLYFVQPTAFARAWLQTVLEHLLTNPEVPRRATDQDSMNIGLAEFGVQWDVPRNMTYHKKLFGTRFTCSRTEVWGKFAGTNLRVSLLPHHQFMRMPMTAQEKPYVVHLYTHGGPRQTAGKLKMLQTEGLQFLRSDWANVSVLPNTQQWLHALLAKGKRAPQHWS